MEGKIAEARPYERRQVVAKFGQIGTFKKGGIEQPLWGMLTFYINALALPIAAKFDRMAPMDKHGFLRLETLQEGEIVVTPGLIYKKVTWSSAIDREHVKAMKTFRPKDLLIAERDNGPAVDMGVINLSGEKETIQ